MKKIVKRILLGIGIIAIAIVVCLVGYMIKFKSEIKKMVPIETKEVVSNIFSVKDTFVNLFLIKDSDNYIAIDAGNNIDIVSAELKELYINPEKVVAVFLTHTHADHVAAIKLFKNAKIFLSKDEEQMINGETSVFLFVGNKIDTRIYSLIEDNQLIKIGNIKVLGISTPGHTPGSMSYIINDTCLFTGDALSLKNGKIEKFNPFFNMDSKGAIISMDKIAETSGAKYIFTAHYGYSKDYENAVKDFGK